MTTRVQSPHFNSFIYRRREKKVEPAKRLSREEELKAIESLVQAGRVVKLPAAQPKPMGPEARPCTARGNLGY